VDLLIPRDKSTFLYNNEPPKADTEAKIINSLFIAMQANLAFANDLFFLYERLFFYST